MKHTEDLPLPDPDLYEAESNWHAWVEYALNKPVAFVLENVEELVGGCRDDTLVLPIFTEVYCKAFTKAVQSYTWTISQSPTVLQTLPVTELSYHVIVEGLLQLSVIPYIRQHFLQVTDKFDILHSDMILFIQDPTNFEIMVNNSSRRTGFHVIWFWTESSEQGVNFLEESCKTYLPLGTFLVMPNKGEEMLHLIPTESRNIGVYLKITTEPKPSS